MSFLGSTCSVCNKVSVPPRVFCNICGCVNQVLSDLSAIADSASAVASTLVVREPGAQLAVGKEFMLKKITPTAYVVIHTHQVID